MKQTTKYVGLDVHQATTVTAVREESGRIIARSVLPTDAPALLEYFRGMRGAIHVTFEEATQAQWLHDLLVPVVDRVVATVRDAEAPLAPYTPALFPPRVLLPTPESPHAYALEPPVARLHGWLQPFRRRCLSNHLCDVYHSYCRSL
jgi:hypothetical protein